MAIPIHYHFELRGVPAPLARQMDVAHAADEFLQLMARTRPRIESHTATINSAKRAKSAATKSAPTCTVRLTWQKGCGALAQSTTKKEIMNAATGFNRPAAENAAKAECTSKGGETCKVVVWACNSSK